MTKIALLIVYNHRYDKNIERLEAIYNGRFSHIFHLMPFYDGKKRNVLTVYDNSFEFQGYIAQAYEHLKQSGFSHYVVIADDLIINPRLTESNFFDETGIDIEASFDYEFKDIVNMSSKWFHAKDAVQFSTFNRGVEIKNILPSKDEARIIFEKKGFAYHEPTQWPYRKLREPIKEYLLKLRRLVQLKLFKTKSFAYPLVGGYSDMIVLPANVMPKFCQYCGAFASARLFVEVAIPTAMILSADKVQDIHQILLNKAYILPRHKHLDFLSKMNNSISMLMTQYPSDVLFIHPIKLSKWA